MISLEKVGVPTVSYTAQHFERDALTSADILGLPEVPLAVVDAPFSNHSADEIRSMATGAIDQIERALTERPVNHQTAKAASAEVDRIEDDDLLTCVTKFNELFIERGWSDGLPLVPPTPAAVEKMIEASGLSGDAVIVNGLYPGLGIATVEKIAINGVMAGCKPEHMPVLIAVARAYEGTGVMGKSQAMSTGPNFPVILVSGPIVERLGFNYGTCVLGPGSASHVNTVIGRALRLMLMNIGQAYPGEMDMDTIGTSNKYSFCLAENKYDSPWEPWNVVQGFDEGTSTVSITLVYPGPDVHNFTADNPEELLDTVTSLTGSYIGTASVGRWLYGGRGDPETGEKIYETNLLLLAPSHARLMKEYDWNRQDIAEYLHRNSRIPFEKLYSQAVRPLSTALMKAHPELAWLLDQPDTLISTAEGPQCYATFVVGGEVGRSQYYFGGSTVSTVAIDD